MSWSRRIVQWSLRTFGQPTEASKRMRFADELREWAAQDDPFKKAEEAADMVIVLAGYVHRTTGKELADFVEMKMQINEHRDWTCFGDGTGKRRESPAHEEWERRFRRDWFFSPEGEREALVEYQAKWEVPPDADTIESCATALKVTGGNANFIEYECPDCSPTDGSIKCARHKRFALPVGRGPK